MEMVQSRELCNPAPPSEEGLLGLSSPLPSETKDTIGEQSWERPPVKAQRASKAPFLLLRNLVLSEYPLCANIQGHDVTKSCWSPSSPPKASNASLNPHHLLDWF